MQQYMSGFCAPIGRAHQPHIYHTIHPIRDSCIQGVYGVVSLYYGGLVLAALQYKSKSTANQNIL